MNTNELTILNLATIEPKPVEWLFEPIIPLGKITVICGDPGSGKTTFTIKLASDVSNGINTLKKSEKKGSSKFFRVCQSYLGSSFRV